MPQKSRPLFARLPARGTKAEWGRACSSPGFVHGEAGSKDEGKKRMSDAIQPIVMPKWGLAMQEGMVAQWHVAEGATIEKGQEILDIETSKIANVFESPVAGPLRRIVTGDGETVPVGFLLAVCAEGSVSDGDIDTYIREFRDNFVVEDDGATGPEPETIDVGGRRIRYLRNGDSDGPPVVFIHGYGGDLLSWMFNQEALAESHSTYSVDLPGHGGSTKDVGAGDVAALSDATLAILDTLEIDRAHLVGHSLGGAVSLNLATSHPARVASATLVCPAGLGFEINTDYIEGFIREKRGKKLKPYLEMLVADPSMISKDMVDEVLKYKRLDGVDQALRSIADACFENGRQKLTMTDRLDGVTVPVQVIWGRDDRIVPAKHGEGLPSPIKVTFLDNTGHLAHMEKSSEVNDLIASMVS